MPLKVDRIWGPIGPTLLILLLFRYVRRLTFCVKRVFYDRFQNLSFLRENTHHHNILLVSFGTNKPHLYKSLEFLEFVLSL